MAHFQLPPSTVSRAVTHRTVEEIWYILSGTGEMWRELQGQSSIVALRSGVSLTLPLGTHIQFRATGTEPPAAIGIIMPPWPGEGEAIIVEGPWTPTV